MAVRSLGWGAALLLLLPMLAGCRPFATQADDWLVANTTPAAPEISIAGYWTNSDWGDAYFTQKGSKVHGTLGAYPVRGVVNHDTVHLIIYSRSPSSLPQYTALLWLEERDVLVGRWVRRKVANGRGEGEPILLRRSGKSGDAEE